MDEDEIEALETLLKLSREMLRRASIRQSEQQKLLEEFEDAIEEVADMLAYDYDPRSMGWVGDDGLP